MLEVKNLHVEKDGKKILKGINMKLEKGKVYALSGPNGSGKTTLAEVLVGNPKYKITKGKIILDKKVINSLKPNELAKKGFFLSFQNPTEISGVTISNLLRQAYNSLDKKKLSILEFRKLLEKKAKSLGIEEEFLGRYLDSGFSGGEKKKLEILQLAVLDPKIAILDETDSGLDKKSLELVAKVLQDFRGKDKIILIITHHDKILSYLKPDKIFSINGGKI